MNRGIFDPYRAKIRDPLLKSPGLFEHLDSENIMPYTPKTSYVNLKGVWLCKDYRNIWAIGGDHYYYFCPISYENGTYYFSRSDGSKIVHSISQDNIVPSDCRVLDDLIVENVRIILADEKVNSMEQISDLIKQLWFDRI